MKKQVKLPRFRGFSVLGLILCSLVISITQTQAQVVDIDYRTPKQYIIGGVTVTGAKYLSPNVLISISGLKTGDKILIPGPKVSSAIKRLWKQGILGDVKLSIAKVEGDKVFFNIQVKERPRLTRVQYENFTRGQRDKVGENIKLGRILTSSKKKNIKQRTKEYFIGKGFLDAEVFLEEIPDKLVANGVILKIKVVKKSKVKVRRINFTGNKVFSDKKLRRKLKATKQKKWYRIFKRSKYVQSNFEEDKAKLIAYYNRQGFRDARIIEDKVSRGKDGLVYIDIKIEEGRRYYFRSITWQGNYLYSDEQLGKVLGINKGDVYNLEDLNKRLNFSQTSLDITSLYMDDGYLFFRVTPVEVSIEGDSIDVAMQIYEGPQATINKVILKGNTKTSDHVVIREVRTTPGQKFSRRNIIRTQREIIGLQYFNPENLDIKPVPHPENGNVDIEYTVEEKPSDQIELSGGWGGGFGFIGTLGLVFNNFSVRKMGRLSNWRPLPSGDGQRLALRMQANGTRFQTYSLTFTEPWLGGRKPNSFTVSLSHSIQRNIQFDQVLGSLQVSSVTLSLGRRLKWPDNYFTVINSLGYQVYNNDNFSAFTSAGISQSFTFNTVISRNSIDNPTYSRNGSSLSLSINLTPPYSLFNNKDYTTLSDQEKFALIEYHKWMFDASFFTPIVGDLVFHTRAHFGFLGLYNADVGYGPFERFILGGDGLSGQNFLLGNDIIGLRGYNNNSIQPVRLTDGRQEAGIAFNKFVMELRYPISLNPSATIFILGFLEGGNNWGSYANFNPFDIYRSAGIGARIFMPAFGMLGLDWGYGFDEVRGAPGANKGQFHFTIGQILR
ncbi:outer membrane protein assembly factor BamA [Microscilla marina]|uniref:Outer membrane protein assembly factor BamA n=1 Tax=Microscilla marina ATCC 23134 TaxID=313606 RepID=A1ZP33_MICM2|nr:outer membrane protein assembly factor BamA [Microscilla marina]EAY27825.1 bacterial surface antigen family protein [Microscilla marina ATCC 23134]